MDKQLKLNEEINQNFWQEARERFLNKLETTKSYPTVEWIAKTGGESKLVKTSSDKKFEDKLNVDELFPIAKKKFTSFTDFDTSRSNDWGTIDIAGLASGEYNFDNAEKLLFRKVIEDSPQKDLVKDKCFYFILDTTNFSDSFFSSRSLSDNVNQFLTFQDAIIYVGRGDLKRSISHFINAFKPKSAEFSKRKSAKLRDLLLLPRDDKAPAIVSIQGLSELSSMILEAMFIEDNMLRKKNLNILHESRDFFEHISSEERMTITTLVLTMAFVKFVTLKGPYITQSTFNKDYENRMMNSDEWLIGTKEQKEALFNNSYRPSVYELKFIGKHILRYPSSKHVVNEVNKITIYKCGYDECSFETRNMKHLYIHSCSHFNYKLYCCRICRLDFLSLDKSVSHLKTQHPDQILQIESYEKNEFADNEEPDDDDKK